MSESYFEDKFIELSAYDLFVDGELRPDSKKTAFLMRETGWTFDRLLGGALQTKRRINELDSRFRK